ncbi:SnoaL-like domain-containing protein [Fontimonas thermophila]|uniref:SnoaL-like domain-containing protein n=1 Tax=Fontimonas thermophila TaxID=1076937 RepID=A0A1I2H9Y7_9GAMM|nr:nuclear transport factor 2 family protein [Fontimonas thermophila]SFF27045.1 SnoaL-like domain-containing protein [Fontimonas thermophila]
MDKTREQLLDELLDKQAIYELIMAYANAADRHDHAKMRTLYHEDAIDDHGHFASGPAMDFIDKLPAIQANMDILHHNVTTVNLKLNGNYAEGEVYILAFHKVKDPGGSYDVLIGGRYFDKYEKRNGVWKFSHRAIVADWAYPAHPSAVRLDHPFLSGAYLGKPGPDDPSYRFFSLFTFGAR